MRPDLSGLAPLVAEPGPTIHALPPYVAPPPRPVPATTVPPRNYLEEAYAAIDKSNLYDNSRQAPTVSAPASTCVSTPRRYFRVGRGVPTPSMPYGMPPCAPGLTGYASASAASDPQRARARESASWRRAGCRVATARR